MPSISQDPVSNGKPYKEEIGAGSNARYVSSSMPIIVVAVMEITEHCLVSLGTIGRHQQRLPSKANWEPGKKQVTMMCVTRG